MEVDNDLFGIRNMVLPMAIVPPIASLNMVLVKELRHFAKITHKRHYTQCVSLSSGIVQLVRAAILSCADMCPYRWVTGGWFDPHQRQDSHCSPKTGPSIGPGCCQGTRKSLCTRTSLALPGHGPEKRSRPMNRHVSYPHPAPSETMKQGCECTRLPVSSGIL